jgi:hypothetical protein
MRKMILEKGLAPDGMKKKKANKLMNEETK